jgi:hypothetical protein
MSDLVDGDADGTKSMQIQEQVVDEVFYLAVVVFSEDIAESYAVDGARGDGCLQRCSVRCGQGDFRALPLGW